MTSSDINVMKSSIHIKQYLNEFNKIDKTIKKVINDKNDNPRWLSQYNHVNVEDIINNIKRLGLVQFMQEGNEHEEKFMQTTKNKFIS